MTVLQDVGSEGSLLDQIARLKAENERLQAKASKQASSRVKLKVTEKGGLSIYGLGRFPVTLYRSQWDVLLNMAEEIKEFILDNSAALAVKE